ncbi:MAG: membrane protein insertion efficiency factor YidD [Burkholderiales bacterium]|nr:MAG: membrane protein insertion efficiency factor YidD [Burkholderiales bacterium]
MKRVLAALIRFYRIAISPMTTPRCRFLPTCSDYALQAIERHGALAGGWLAVRRLARCHPFHPGGLDEVPELVSERPPVSCSCRWPAALRGDESTER